MERTTAEGRQGKALLHEINRAKERRSSLHKSMATTSRMHNQNIQERGTTAHKFTKIDGIICSVAPYKKHTTTHSFGTTTRLTLARVQCLGLLTTWVKEIGHKNVVLLFF
jgi:hypothetical protein